MLDLVTIGQSVIDSALANEEIEAYLVRESETAIRVYESDVESLTSADSSGIGIRIVSQKRVGISYAGTLEPDEIARAVAEARDNARFGSADPYAGVASPDDVAPANLDVWANDLGATSTQAKIDAAMSLEKATLSLDKRIRSLNSANYGDVSAEAAVLNSRGVVAYTRQTYCWAWVYALASQNEETQTGYGMHASRDFAGLDIEHAANEAAKKATRMLGATKPTSGLFRAVFEPDISSALISIISSTLSAESVQKGRSIFAGRLGESVAAAELTLVDDPTDKRFFSAASFDDEGLASRRNVLIENGELKSFLYDSYTGRKDDHPSTGSAIRGGIAGSISPGPRATMLAAGDASPEEIVAKVNDGVLIQSISGIHSGVNPISGDFSVGAEGIQIRNGELQGAIKEFTIASNLQKMLKDIVSVGSDLTFRPGGSAGVTLAIDNINVSGS